MEPATTAQYSAFVVAHNKALSAGWGLLFGLAYAGAAVCWHAPQRANADLLFASALAVVSVCFAVAALLGHQRILRQSAITYCWLCLAWYMLGLILLSNKNLSGLQGHLNCQSLITSDQIESFQTAFCQKNQGLPSN